MRTVLLFLFVGWGYTSYAQNRITITGDPTDSTVIKKKRRLEANGFEVTIKPSATDENPLLTMGDQAFRQKYINKPLPAFSLKDMNGVTITSDDLKGKYVHINFWSTTCVPCIKEFPELNELKKKYSDRPWVFLAFAPESTERVRNILAKRPLEYTIIADARAYYQQLGIDGYPKNFFIDKLGMIRQVTDGTRFIRDPQSKEERPDNYQFYDQIMASMN